MICKICKKEFETNRILGVHIKKSHKISTEEYYLQYVGTRQKCIMCGKETKFISLTLGYRQHCCNQCAQLDPNVAVNREQGCIKNFGYSNSMKNPKICNDAIIKRTNNIKQIANQENLIEIPQSKSYMLSRICTDYEIKIIMISYCLYLIIGRKDIQFSNYKYLI